MNDLVTVQNTDLVPFDAYGIDEEEFRRQIKVSNNTISTRGKQFKFPDGNIFPTIEQCIIIDHVNFYAYYPKPWDPDLIENPECWAIHKFENELAPLDTVQNQQSIKCKDCEQNKWIKDPKKPTKNIKICKNQLRVALVAPDATETSDIYILTVPPTGLKYWIKYTSALRGLRQIIQQHLTSITWDPKVQQTMMFNSKGFHSLEPSTIASLRRRCAEEQLLYVSPER